MKGEGRFGPGILEYGSISRKPAAPSSPPTPSTVNLGFLPQRVTTVFSVLISLILKQVGVQNNPCIRLYRQKKAVGDGAPTQFMDIIG